MTKTTDKRRMTKHQGVGGQNSGEKSLWSGPNRWERSDPRPEDICTRRTDSNQRGSKGYGGGMWNSYCDTQHPVGASRGAGDHNTCLTAGQHQDRSPAGNETHRRHSHATELGLHGIGDRDKDPTPRGVFHCMEGRGGMGGSGIAEFWTKRGKFCNHIGTETLVRCQVLRAAQIPTCYQLDKAIVRVRAERDEEDACRRHQRLPGKYEGPTRRTTSDRPRGIWTDGPSTTIFTETELLIGGELDVENVDGGETYLGVGRLYLRDMRRLIHGRPTGT